MKSIGFKNFRRFEELKSMPFGEITLLVGGNNAGKSTIGKAVRLAINNIKALPEKPSDALSESGINIFGTGVPVFRFDGTSLNIGDFKSALRYGAKRPEMQFMAALENFDIDLSIAMDQEESVYGLIRNIKITDKAEQCRYEFNIAEHTSKMTDLGESKKIRQTKDELSALVSMLERARFELQECSKQLNEAQNNHLDDKNINKKSFAELITAISNRSAEVSKLETIINQKNTELNAFESRGGDVLAEYILSVDLSVVHDNLLFSFLRGLSNAVYSAKRQLSSEEKAQMVEDAEETEGMSTEDRQDVPEAAKIINRTISNLKQALTNEQYVYIAAHEAAQKSFYYAEATDSVSLVVCEFVKQIIKKGSAEYRFVEKWLCNLGIGKTFNIESMKGEAFRVQITEENGHPADLSELGKGAIQYMTLLLRLATIMRKYRGTKVTIIIEEPEQNMHPDWQSLLADLFYEINRDYGFRFLIETHSEYLIRKTQVLVANGDYKDQKDVDENCPFKVYFLPSDGDLYDMHYQPSGRFVENFGTGFFDEAGKMHMDILKRQNKG